MLPGLVASEIALVVNVEADVLAGPLLAERARKAGVVYSLAFGDQPAVAQAHEDLRRIGLGEQLAFEIEAWGEIVKGVAGARIAIDAAMLAPDKSVN